MKDKLLNCRAIPLVCLFRNTLPDCPRCVGGHLLADNLIGEISCINCGYYLWSRCYKNRRNGHKRLSICLFPENPRVPRTKLTKSEKRKERRWRNKMIVKMVKEGYTHKEITFKLDISKSAISSLYRKQKEQKEPKA